MRSERDLLRPRLHAQRLMGRRCGSAGEVIELLGAVQAQDFGGALWALGQRIAGTSEAALGEAFDRGEYLRTHLLRPTWHLVSPADLRWMLELTAPRVHLANASQYRAMGLGASDFRKSQSALQRALRGGGALTRTEVGAVLRSAGSRLATPLHQILLLMAAELDGVICSGPRRGKQHTYMLIDERVPQRGRRFRGAEATAELARRYLAAHGPATAHDLAWWSGLKRAEVTVAIAGLRGELASATVGGVTYWWQDSALAGRGSSGCWLLPNYDEYLVAYADRRAAFGGIDAGRVGRGSLLFNHTLVIGGRVAGTWRRTLSRRQLVVEVTTLRALSRSEVGQVERAVTRLGGFLGLPARLQLRAGP